MTPVFLRPLLVLTVAFALFYSISNILILRNDGQFTPHNIGGSSKRGPLHMTGPLSTNPSSPPAHDETEGPPMDESMTETKLRKRQQNDIGQISIKKEDLLTPIILTEADTLRTIATEDVTTVGPVGDTATASSHSASRRKSSFPHNRTNTSPPHQLLLKEVLHRSSSSLRKRTSSDCVLDWCQGQSLGRQLYYELHTPPATLPTSQQLSDDDEQRAVADGDTKLSNTNVTDRVDQNNQERRSPRLLPYESTAAKLWERFLQPDYGKGMFDAIMAQLYDRSGNISGQGAFGSKNTQVKRYNSTAVRLARNEINQARLLKSAKNKKQIKSASKSEDSERKEFAVENSAFAEAPLITNRAPFPIDFEWPSFRVRPNLQPSRDKEQNTADEEAVVNLLHDHENNVESNRRSFVSTWALLHPEGEDVHGAAFPPYVNCEDDSPDFKFSFKSHSNNEKKNLVLAYGAHLKSMDLLPMILSFQRYHRPCDILVLFTLQIPDDLILDKNKGNVFFVNPGKYLWEDQFEYEELQEQESSRSSDKNRPKKKQSYARPVPPHEMAKHAPATLRIKIANNFLKRHGLISKHRPRYEYLLLLDARDTLFFGNAFAWLSSEKANNHRPEMAHIWENNNTTTDSILFSAMESTSWKENEMNRNWLSAYAPKLGPALAKYLQSAYFPQSEKGANKGQQNFRSNGHDEEPSTEDANNHFTQLSLRVSCSGLIGGSFLAVLDYLAIFQRAIDIAPTSALSQLGIDQGIHNYLQFFALPLLSFPHRVLLLDDAVGPYRHWFKRNDVTWFDSRRQESSPLSRGTHESNGGSITEGALLNCHGKPFAVVHQLDRYNHLHGTIAEQKYWCLCATLNRPILTAMIKLLWR